MQVGFALPNSVSHREKLWEVLRRPRPIGPWVEFYGRWTLRVLEEAARLRAIPSYSLEGTIRFPDPHCHLRVLRQDLLGAIAVLDLLVITTVDLDRLGSRSHSP